MANHGCINGTLDGANYTSPMPLTGLYVAVATLLCLALMVHDVVVAILARKRWLPSKLFGFNSATMIVLSIAVKLPLDLTTAIPSPQDQLSKLAGTVLICISMAFLMPSLGANSESERFTNMLGFSIFVITVAVNICIQIYTGIIVLFITQHIIILSLMLLLIVMLWFISSYIKGEKSITNDQLNNFLAKGDPNMFGRVRLCHLYVYCSDPQFKISVHPMNVVVSTISLICSGILVQATYRSLILKKLEFCQGKSDYDWSILIIVVVQVLTVIVGTIAIVFRWLSLFNRMEFEETLASAMGWDDPDGSMGYDYYKTRRQTLRKVLFRYKLLKFFTFLFKIIIFIAQLLIAVPWVLVRKMFRAYKHDSLEILFALPHEGLISAHEGIICAPGYMVRNGIDELTRFKNQVDSNESLNHLRQFLSQETLSGRGVYRGENYSEYLGRQHRKVCFLSIALLVKIAEASIPYNYLGGLQDAFKEAMEIIHFVDKMMTLKDILKMETLSYAKDLSICGDFTWMFSDNINGIQPALNCTKAKLHKMARMSESDWMFSEVSLLIGFINLQSYSSVDELVRFIEQMLFEMMHILLPQLPLAVYKMLNGSPMEEFEERIRFAMKLMFQTKSLDGHINWLFPGGPEISSFGALDSDDLHHPFGEPRGPVGRLVQAVRLRDYDEETNEEAGV